MAEEGGRVSAGESIPGNWPGAVVQAQERPERAFERPSEATTDLTGLSGRQLHLLLEGLHFLGDPDAALREQLEAAYRRVARKENPCRN